MIKGRVNRRYLSFLFFNVPGWKCSWLVLFFLKVLATLFIPRLVLYIKKYNLFNFHRHLYISHIPTLLKHFQSLIRWMQLNLLKLSNRSALFNSNIYDCFSIDLTAIQIEKTLVNDCLSISKLSWKFCIPTIY